MAQKKYNNQEIRKYVGDLSQVAGIKKYELKGGRAKGVGAFDVKTGGGLNYTVLSDRALDIAWAEFKGTSFSYISNTGVVAPEYFEEEGFRGMRSMALGLTTTVGLDFYGLFSAEDDDSLGSHGRIGNLPAEEVSYQVNLDADEPYTEISGKVRQAKFFGEYLILNRTIKSYLGQKKIIIEDSVKNLGFERSPLMFLYHVNFGYPLLQEGAEVVLPVQDIIPRDEEAEKGVENHQIVEKPQPGYNEQVFYLDLAADDEGYSYAAIVNEELNLGVYEKFKKERLPRFLQWKQMGEGFYVMGLEPCTNYFSGRSAEAEEGRLQFIEAGETREFGIEIGVLEGQKEIKEFRSFVSALK